MDENEMLTTEEGAETTDAFLDGWEDTAGTGAPEDQPEQDAGEGAEAAKPEKTQEENEQPAEDAAETKPEEESPAKEDAPPKTWTLRHLDEEKTVNEQEMTALAQKGLDYDRIRERYDASKPVMELFGQFAKQAGMSVEDYVSHIRTQAKQAAGMNEADAKRAVELEDREAAIAAKEAVEAEQQAAAQEQSAAEARRQADIAEFQKTFPEAAKDPKSIPPEVWAEVRGGLSLVAAYAKWQVAQAKAAQEAARQSAAAAAQNGRNAVRSTGSMKSAGSDTKSKDPFLEGWNS